MAANVVTLCVRIVYPAKHANVRPAQTSRPRESPPLFHENIEGMSTWMFMYDTAHPEGTCRARGFPDKLV